MNAPGNLRLTGGIARGRPLRNPVPAGVRPTAARVREALFSLVGQRLEGSSFLDACAGTGLVGLEAWSRGAEVTWVERDPAVAGLLAQNVRALGAPPRVLVGDVFQLLSQLGPFDLVYVDPPYDQPLNLDPLTSIVGSTLVVERRSGQPAPTPPSAFRAEPGRKYGEAMLWLFHRTDERS